MRVAQRSEQIGMHINVYLCAHSTPPDAILRELAHETAEWYPAVRSRCRSRSEQGTFMTMLTRLIGARRRCRDRHVHRVLLDLPGPRAGRRRPPAVLRRQRGVDVGGPQVLGTGRRWPTGSSCASGRPWTRCGRCPATPRSTSRSSTPTSRVTWRYWNEVVPRVRPGGAILVDNTFSHGRVIDAGNESELVQAGPRLQRARAADDRVVVTCSHSATASRSPARSKSSNGP